jgi:hypothetical protein
MASVSLETLVLGTVFCPLTKKNEEFFLEFFAIFRVKIQLNVFLSLFFFFGQNFLQIFYITNLKENPN